MSNFIHSKPIVHTQPYANRTRVIPLLFAFAFAMSVSVSAQAIAQPGDSPLERILGRGLAGGVGMAILVGLVLLLYRVWTAIERMRKRRATPPASATSNISSTISSADLATTPPAGHADDLYEKALDELEKGQTVSATWARALAEGNGDDAKARATYIRLRVTQVASHGQGKTEARGGANAIAPVPGTKRWAIIATAVVLALFILIGLGSFRTGLALFTSDGKDYAECMENRRDEIKNQSQMAVAAQYCVSKHSPAKTPEIAYDPEEDIRFVGTGQNRPTLVALIKNIAINQLSVKHVGMQYSSGVKSFDFRYYLSAEVFNKNEFPIVGIILGVNDRAKIAGRKCSWDESDYVDIYQCSGVVAGKTSGSFACEIPDIEKRKIGTCLIGFTLRANNANVKRFMDAYNIPPRT